MSDGRKITFPIVVSGPSGVGKTTLCHRLIERDSKFAFSVSATTRVPRSTEKHGKDYFFISEQEFETMKAGGEFAEWAVVHGDLYGTPRRWLDDRLLEGISVLLDIDVQGGVQMMHAYPQGVSIFVVPPSFRVLEQRLRGRKSETDEAVRRRLQNALREMEYITEYTYIVVNDTIDEAVSEMETIITAEGSKRERILSGTSWQEVIGLEPKGRRE